jgi:hypothetical protein
MCAVGLDQITVYDITVGRARVYKVNIYIYIYTNT